MDITTFIADIEDFPKPGVTFKDITPLLGNAAAFHATIDQLCAQYLDKGVTKILSMEARGFMFASAMCYKMQAGFVPARKPGKLPREVVTAEYILEYGTDSLEIHHDGINADDVVLIVDDVLATGGTAAAAACLVRDCNAKIAGYAFVMELDFLNPREKLDPSIPIFSITHVK